MIKELRQGVYVHSSHIQKMQSVIVADERALYVFDPCYFSSEIEEIREFAKGLETPERSRWLILTHSDFDHIAGAHYFPGYQVVVSKLWDESNEVSSIEKIEMFDSEFYVDRPWSGKMARVPIHHNVTDGDQIESLTFYEAKGHTWDGLISVFGDIAIVGDYLSAVEFPFVYTSYKAYQQTLAVFRQLLQNHDIRCVITQHGHAAEDPEEIMRRIELSEDYLHRAELLVEEGIGRGWSVERIVEAGSDFQYDGQPIPIGIRSFHDKNLKLIWEEKNKV
jgi:hydroxyacylglutathione hydrolase